MDEIGLPEKCRELLRRPRGLVLVTSPTGSNRSTVRFASMIDWINTHQDRHIITIETPSSSSTRTEGPRDAA
ncbi:MAG: ATPase, T2SS/T4P/T4SS family [Planctomycetota bacterium]